MILVTLTLTNMVVSLSVLKSAELLEFSFFPPPSHPYATPLYPLGQAFVRPFSNLCFPTSYVQLWLTFLPFSLICHLRNYFATLLSPLGHPFSTSSFSLGHPLTPPPHPVTRVPWSGLCQSFFTSLLPHFFGAPLPHLFFFFFF